MAAAASTSKKVAWEGEKDEKRRRIGEAGFGFPPKISREVETTMVGWGGRRGGAWVTQSREH